MKFDLKYTNRFERKVILFLDSSTFKYKNVEIVVSLPNIQCHLLEQRLV